MFPRKTVVGTILAAVLSIGWADASGQLPGSASRAPAPLVTNLVAQRVVGDLIHTLLEVGPGSSIHAAGNTNWALAVQRARDAGHPLITNDCAGFVPGSLASNIWAGLHFAGRSTNMYAFYRLPTASPPAPPVLRWNTNSLLWNRKGMTAISQVFEGMGAFGQGAITALTRRHGYSRGHHMGPSGLQPEKAGRRIWFCTRDNRVIERRAQFFLVRAPQTGGPGDYSLIFFDQDLPPEIEPMRVADQQQVHRKYFVRDSSRKPLFMALQGGLVSGGFGQWRVAIRGGDSGCPIMLPLPGQVVFIGGVTTSPPTPRMQIDMDLLTLRAGLDPADYQMQWVNLDAYPDF